jgi:hypothetical protein
MGIDSLRAVIATVRLLGWAEIGVVLTLCCAVLALVALADFPAALVLRGSLD